MSLPEKRPHPDSSESASPSSPKRRRPVGPTMPPPGTLPADTAAPTPDPASDADSDSDSDSDYGPSLPPPPPSSSAIPTAAPALAPAPAPAPASASSAPSFDSTNKPQRDAWMLLPPTNDDWAKRIDPTKLRNRKFNSRPAGPVSSGGGDEKLNAWTETAEQKRARLAAQVLGISQPGQEKTSTAVKKDTGPFKTSEAVPDRNEVVRKKVEEIKQGKSGSKKDKKKEGQGMSLLEMHRRNNPGDLRDDPSARPFDREKDMSIFSRR